MSRTLEGIVGDLMTNSETGEVYSPARVVESRIREAYALGAASRSGESEVGWIVRPLSCNDLRTWTPWSTRAGAEAYRRACRNPGDWKIVRVRITVEPEEGI